MNRNLRNLRKGILPEVYDIPKELGFGLAHLGLAWIRMRSACARRLSGGRPVVYVHGIAVNSGSFLPMRLYQAAVGNGAGFVYEYNTASTDFDRSARGLRRLLDALTEDGDICPPPEGEKLTIVAHSLGGVIVRRYLQLYPRRHPVGRVILMSVPNYGTHLAHYVPTDVTFKLLPDSPFLKKLNDGSHLADGINYISMYGDKDLFILPRESMYLEGSERVVLRDHSHNSVMFSLRVFSEVAMRIGPAGGAVAALPAAGPAAHAPEPAT